MAGFEEESFKRSIKSSRGQRVTVYDLCSHILVSSSLLLYDILCSSGTGNIFIFYKNCLYKIIFILFLLNFMSF